MNLPDRAEVKRTESMQDSLLLSWRVHLWKRRPWKGLLALVLLLGTITLLWCLLGLFPALLLGLALFFSVAPFFLPQEYRLYPQHLCLHQGLSGRVWRWDFFRRACRRGGVILLSPFSAAHPLEKWRDLVIVPAGNEEAVWSVVNSCLKANGGESRQGLS